MLELVKRYGLTERQVYTIVNKANRARGAIRAGA